MLGFPIGVLTANAFEWYAHRAWLHDYPRQHRDSPLFMHWRHHKRVRLNAYFDDMYTQSMLDNAEVYTEKTLLIGLCAATTMVAPVAPFFTLGTYYGAWNYYRVHKRSHLDPEWGRRHVPWHYDHHMNTNQDANWCVTRPWFDYIMGTRVIADPAHAETNPLGMTLPRIVEKPLNKLARKLLPHAYARIAAASAEEAHKQGMPALASA